MTRLGLFGGTFDPIHVGHLDVVEAAARALALDRVVLVPARVPPHRASPRASAAHRFAMAALALRGKPGVVLSDLEMQSDEPSYTNATLDRLAEHGFDTRGLFLVTGADAFREISTWRGYPDLLDRCHFVVVSRPGHPASTLPRTLPTLSGRMIASGPAFSARLDGPKVILVDAPTAPVSATDIRRRIADGTSIQGLVPDDVATYIDRHELYKERGHDFSTQL
jgi:nicotinate-nucleotide adenylyltransferase